MDLSRNIAMMIIILAITAIDITKVKIISHKILNRSVDMLNYFVNLKFQGFLTIKEIEEMK
jgi:hypothetical protein